MSALKDLNVRPIRQEDISQLDKWRREYPDAFLAWHYGLVGDGVETVCAEKNGKLIGSLTGVKAVIVDPFVHDPAASPTDVFGAAYLMERLLAYEAQKGGAIAAYTSIAVNEPKWRGIVERSGYSLTFQDCAILRRAFKTK